MNPGRYSSAARPRSRRTEFVAEARFAHAIALEDAGRPDEALAQYRALLRRTLDEPFAVLLEP